MLLVVLSLPIFYNALQAANNYVSAEKYYKATLDAENIITQIKASLDYKVKGLSGSSVDIESTFDSSVIASKVLDVPTNLSYEDGKSLFTAADIDALNLNLEKEKYSYEAYLKKLDTAISIPSARTKGNDVYKFKYGPKLTTQPISMIISGSNFVSGSTPTITNPVLMTTVLGDLLILEYIVDAADTITAPINISTYNMDSNIMRDAKKVKLIVRNHSCSNIDINLFTNLAHTPMEDILVSYQDTGAIYVVTNPQTLPIPQCSYAIVVVVTDNTRGNKILVQLTDVYSYVPK
jgi:hypothetical protein